MPFDSRKGRWMQPHDLQELQISILLAMYGALGAARIVLVQLQSIRRR